jgi:type III secretory pathway component EscR
MEERQDLRSHKENRQSYNFNRSSNEGYNSDEDDVDSIVTLEEDETLSKLTQNIKVGLIIIDGILYLQ